MDTTTIISYAVGAILSIIFFYVLTRAVSFAYFRTKLEYLRKSLKELNGGNNHNG